MITAKDVRDNAMKCEALVEAFENTYLDILTNGEDDEQHTKEKACRLVYAIHDALDALIDDMTELSGHMEVCNAILAVEHLQELQDKLTKGDDGNE